MGNFSFAQVIQAACQVLNRQRQLGRHTLNSDQESNASDLLPLSCCRFVSRGETPHPRAPSIRGDSRFLQSKNFQSPMAGKCSCLWSLPCHRRKVPGRNRHWTPIRNPLTRRIGRQSPSLLPGEVRSHCDPPPLAMGTQHRKHVTRCIRCRDDDSSPWSQ